MLLATFNDILLSGFLFIVYFSILSWIYTNQENYQPVPSTSPKFPDFSQPINYFPDDDDDQLTGEDQEICCLLEDAPSSSLKGQKYELINPLKVLSNNSNKQPNHQNYDQIIEVIKKLTKRQSRKLCQPLSIQQKCNGIEKTTQLMRAEISRKFKENPNLVITVIKEKLPEILAKLSINENEPETALKQAV